MMESIDFMEANRFFSPVAVNKGGNITINQTIYNMWSIVCNVVLITNKDVTFTIVCFVNRFSSFKI